MEKKFSFEVPANKEGRPNYQDKILSVINEVKERVRVVNPDEQLYKELHAKRVMDSRQEMKEYEPVRKDICETFGVPFDDEHMVMFDPHRTNMSGPIEQRALRCFYVLIDSIHREGFYGEGRTMHHVLLNKIIEKVKTRFSDADEDSVLKG